MILGVIGVFIFSITLPATRIALVKLSPLTVGIGRSTVAAIVAAFILIISRQPWPTRSDVKKAALRRHWDRSGLPPVFGFGDGTRRCLTRRCGGWNSTIGDGPCRSRGFR
jgi:hypothetical protein